VLFEPKTTRFWVANASADQEPAATQPYYQFQLTELLKRQPDSSAKEIPMPEITAKTAAKERRAR
jgi:hypothetical protein